MSRRFVALLMVGMVGSGCAHSQSGAANVESDINYSDPIVNGVQVATPAAAAANINAFQVYTPLGLSGSETIYVTALGTPSNSQAVAFVYQTSTYGLVDVVEGVPAQSTTAAYNAANEALVALNGQPYTHGSITTVSIRGSEEGFLSTNEDGSLNTMFWMERGMEFTVEGPTVTGAQVEQIANSI